MGTFAVAIFFLLVTPGPGVLSLAGVGSAYGYRQGWAYGTGLFIGSNLVLIAAATGLAALFLADERIRLVFTVLSTTYLLYMAAKIAFAGSKIAFIQATKPPGLWGGIALQVINPKAYVVGTFVFSNFTIWPQSLTIEVVIKLIILNAIWIPIHILWLAAGVTLNRLALEQRTQRIINFGMAAAMLLVVGIAMWSTFYGGQ
ncbi:MAG: LysE family transporter [Rhizobiaceae bacterium]|nr:LysE family transporter [Hyphomicrobiales bacterium]NRB29406.1 LysE family transporter [Rhizobiaceae bacterium]